MIVVLMGVSGAGKTAVGARLAARLGWAFVDADDLHPASNVAKMRAGVPLTDADRAPWLREVGAAMDDLREDGRSGVVACSALKATYRDVLLDRRPEARLVYLRASRAELERRLRARRDHFFDPELLDSQLATLEEPDGGEALIVDADAGLDAVVRSVLSGLGLS